MANENIRSTNALRETLHRQGASPIVVIKRYVNFASGLLAIIIMAIFIPSASTRTASVLNIAGITPPTPPGGSGNTVAGFPCGPGKLQIPWSKYSPICEPKWNGDNGGATSNGVTASSINLSYRYATTSQLSLLYAVVHPNVIGTNDQAVQTMNAYISLFNKEFELYGRKVNLEKFVGRGNFISEDQGGGLVEAKEDAVYVAHNLNAFADMSLVDASSTYGQDLANQGVVTSSIYENSQDYYTQNAPYAYSPGPNCSNGAIAGAALAAKSVYGLPATNVGDANLKGLPGKIAIIYQDTPQWITCADETANYMETKYGLPKPLMLAYAFNVSEFSQEAASMMAQLKTSGVTSVICSGCDPVTPAFLFPAADNQNYHPEWILSELFSNGLTMADGYGTLYPQDQMDHVVGFGIPTPQLTADQEAYQAYLKTGSPLSELAPSYPYIYASLLQFYDALQSAGPDLTPLTFEEGMFNARGDLQNSLPGGNYGPWSFGKNIFDPVSGFGIVAWDPNATSHLSGTDFNGKKGAFVACNNGAIYNYSDFAASLPDHVPLSCP